MTTDAEFNQVATFTVSVCHLCLGGAEGECHTPECVFFICPAPTFEQAERLAYAAKLNPVVSSWSW